MLELISGCGNPIWLTWPQRIFIGYTGLIAAIYAAEIINLARALVYMNR